MTKIVRALIVVLVAVFVAGTIAQTASAMIMNVKMSLAVTGDPDKGDCAGCTKEDGKAPVCSVVCVSLFVATLTPVEIAVPRAAPGFDVPPGRKTTGHTGPPEPYPPRSNILI